MSIVNLEQEKTALKDDLIAEYIGSPYIHTARFRFDLHDSNGDLDDDIELLQTAIRLKAIREAENRVSKNS